MRQPCVEPVGLVGHEVASRIDDRHVLGHHPIGIFERVGGPGARNCYSCDNSVLSLIVAFSASFVTIVFRGAADVIASLSLDGCRSSHLKTEPILKALPLPEADARLEEEVGRSVASGGVEPLRLCSLRRAIPIGWPTR